MNTPARHATILFSHGSRDPLWRTPIEAVKQHILSQQPQALVACAYLELCEPDLQHAVQQLMEQGAQQLTVVPMFLGTGKHAREDLPKLVHELQQRYCDLSIHVQVAIGEDPRMTALMAHIALEQPCDQPSSAQLHTDATP